MTRNILLVSVVLLGLPFSAATAALYQFTLIGEVAEANWPNVSKGDPVNITYIADSQDRSADPALGSYWVSVATFTFPNATFSTGGPGTVQVNLDFPEGTDRVRYLRFLPNDDLTVVPMEFPVGTLPSDALPTSLPLSKATSAGFAHFGYFGGSFSGSIETYESVEVPEPGAGAAMLAVVLLLRGTSAR